MLKKKYCSSLRMPENVPQSSSTSKQSKRCKKDYEKKCGESTKVNDMKV